MRKIIIFLFSLLTYIPVVHGVEDIQRVAVIDTGLSIEDPRFKPLICGYKDFTGEGMVDKLGHGTHVTGTIKRVAGRSKYCLIILKYASTRTSPYENTINMLFALREAVAQKANIVNISAGGSRFLEDEYLLIKSNPQIIFVAAAGNYNKNIDLIENSYYPASYSLNNVISVGALTATGQKAPKSNYGNSVKMWALGEDVISDIPCPTNDCQTNMSGTSMATSIVTGIFIKKANDALY